MYDKIPYKLKKKKETACQCRRLKKRKKKKDMVYIHNGKLLSHQKE